MATDGEPEVVNRRKSGRVTRKPGIFGEDQHDASVLSGGSTKRKRASTLNGNHEDGDKDDNDAEVEDSSSEDESDESEPDVEELKDRRRTQKKSAVTKPAVKRTKTTNGASTTLAIRSAGGGGAVRQNNKTAKLQKARARPSQVHATGLYADVFGKGNTATEAATAWHEGLQNDNVAGIRDFVNFVLQCIGCDARVESADIEDIDNVPNRLGEVLDEYAGQKSTDYPLVSKLKQYSGLKEVLNAFANAMIHTLHNSGMLYEEKAVYDNIHIWTATMSGAGYRPFRHTATVVSLSMTSALCEVAQELQKTMSVSKGQIDAEKKKKSTNKGRLKKLQEEMKQEEERLEHVNSLLRDAFDTVYVHRYRDVDEKVRVECASALGRWIELYRTMFLEGQYLRYLGWVLSDPNAPTRLEVVRALKALFKDRRNVGALRAFTDRFRERLVEMGSRDTDTSVRAEAIELLDRLRNAELLKADDIDTIGQLIFDNEPRVRKAVAKFFVSNIQDLYEASTEGFDQEQYAAALPAVDDVDDSLDPCQTWIKFKCLAQMLSSHDKDSESRRSGERTQEVYGTEDAESRYMLATQSIYPFMPELQKWESLAGYLLYDHSTINAEADDADVELAVQGVFKLEDGEDTILLDVLQYAVKLSLQGIQDLQIEKKSKRSQASKDEVRRKQEAAAQHLTLILPQLLNKYGGTPEAAASILRLEQLLDIDLINDLQTGEGSYVNILEDINKQFNSHNDRKVLAEASKAFRAARTYETSQEAVDAKVAEIWSDSKEALAASLQGKNIPARGTIDRNNLRGVGDVMGRLAQLAAISDCTEVLESKMSSAAGRKGKVKGLGQDTFLDVLLQLTNRGVADEDTTEQFAELEDRLCGSVLTTLSLYFRWKIVSLRKAIMNKDTKSLTTSSLTNLAMHRTSFVEVVLPVISTRQPLDPIRVNAILTLLDLFTLFATVRHMKPDKGDLDDEVQSNLNSLVTTVSSDMVTLVMETHEKMEKRLSRKTNKRIELNLKPKKSSKRQSGTPASAHEAEDEEDIEKPPEDSDDEANGGSDSDEDASSSDDDEANKSGKTGREAKKQATLIAEQALCELASKIVLATIAGVLGSDGKIKGRLQINRTRLGKSYGQIIAYLDEKKVSKKSKTTATKGEKSTAATASAPSAGASNQPTKGQTTGKKPLSEPMVIEEDDIEDDEEQEEAEQDEEEEEEDNEEYENEDERTEKAGSGGGEDAIIDDEIMGD